MKDFDAVVTKTWWISFFKSPPCIRFSGLLSNKVLRKFDLRIKIWRLKAKETMRSRVGLVGA